MLITVKHVFKKNLTCLTQLCNFFSILFYHLPPICLESEIIYFGAPTFLSPNFVDYGKYVLRKNLHGMGGIYKEGCLWDFLIKFSFGCLQNFTPGTFVWMIEYSSHCAVIVADDDNNDKEAII